ncbi:MAG: ABC transporter permease [Cyclobacteriaceae bacterium]
MIEPPKFPFRLLRWFCKPWYVESIEGDLYELFLLDAQENQRKASRMLYLNAIRFLRWRYLKNLEDIKPLYSIIMLKTFIKVTIRNFQKSKLQTALNVFGLSIGIACCLLMIIHVNHQLSFDKNIPKADQIYRVTLGSNGPFTPARLVKQLRLDYPEVINGTRISGPVESVITIGEQFVKESKGLMADSTFFELFPNEFLSGDASSALNGPNDMVLTESLAEKLFGEENPIGKTMEIMGYELEVTAIVRDPAKATTVPYSYVAAIPWEKWATDGWWTGNNFYSYIMLHPDVNIAQLQVKIPDFVERYIGPEILQYYPNYESFAEYLVDHDHSFKFVPMADIHLHHSRLTLGSPGDFQELVIFSFIAFFILLLACINYINMATARASLRAKEIGIRKVLGSIRNQVASQFMIESFVTTLIALLVGVLLSILVLPYFNGLTDMSYNISSILSLTNSLGLLVILLVTSLLSGVYPALFLSSIRPVDALKGSLSKSGSTRLRSSLVVFQFAISLFLISATFIVFQQLNKMSDRKLGVDAEQVLVIQSSEKIDQNYEAFRNELMAYSGIANVGISNSYPSSFISDWNYTTLGDNPVKLSPYNIFASPEIADVWGLKIKEGRFFDEKLVSDSSCVVVNEKLVETLGWQGDAIGKMLSRGEGKNFRIIGVVEDFVTGSARRSQYPLLFRYANTNRGDFFGNSILMVKIKGDILSSIDHIEAKWNDYMGDYPMESIFMDDSFNRLYDAERRFSSIFTGFSVLAILIACIGLYSLATFVLNLKRKEIAVRKVLGAHVSQIFNQICLHFGKLLLIGAFIAIPTAFYLGKLWLNDYIVRIELGVLVFALPFILLLLIALTTVSYQVYRSASDNPSEALKEE